MILVKFPTRSRPERFLEYLSLYVSTQSTKQVTYLISIDNDDYTANEEFIDRVINITKDCIIVKGISNNKIHACNRDMDQADDMDWRTLVLASDDMKPNALGWDKIISDGMRDHFPDGDGVLNFSDGYSSLNTMCIMGRKYYDRFGYIYHPDYTSLWCDNEFQEVSRILGKEKKFDQVLFMHEHPANNNGVGNDMLYIRNERYYRQDKSVFDKRKSNNFDL